jgi:hypothetical protein
MLITKAFSFAQMMDIFANMTTKENLSQDYGLTKELKLMASHLAKISAFWELPPIMDLR